jgi:hypothetical protein
MYDRQKSIYDNNFINTLLNKSSSFEKSTFSVDKVGFEPMSSDCKLNKWQCGNTFYPFPSHGNKNQRSGWRLKPMFEMIYVWNVIKHICSNSTNHQQLIR